MAIVTLARQVGSGGQSIAAVLAARLGYRSLGRREFRVEAERAGFHLPPSFEAFANEDRLASMGTASGSQMYVSYGELEYDGALRGIDAAMADRAVPSFLDSLMSQRREILLALQAVVYRLAAADRVIFVGGGSQILLGDTPGVLRVKIVASEEIRIARLSSAYGLSEEDAMFAVRRGDREQRDYNRAIFGADWDDPLLWDMVVNTDRLTVEGTSEWIASLVARSPFADEPSAETANVLAAAAEINHRLWGSTKVHNATIVAVPVGEAVAMRGDAPTVAVRDEAVEIGASISPGSLVRDEILIAQDHHAIGVW